MKIFSGIRPSGKLHLGNYLGAIKNWIKLQEEADLAIYAVVDLHGITTPYNPKTYQNNVMDVIMDYLAAGIDPNKSLLIRQSKVPQHTELAWLFNTITPVSWLDRLPTYKEQLAKSPKYNHMGLLDYPVLMAADILIYRPDIVPVGEDQKPHIEITNEIGKKFNNMFGDTFPNIKINLAEGARIMSLKTPENKMSKTGDEGISLSDSSNEIRVKIKGAVTDSGSEIKYDKGNKPAISNLLTIYSILSDKNISDIEKEYDGKGYVEFKNDLAEVVIDYLEPFQQKRNELEKNPDFIISILESSEEKARDLAEQTMVEVRKNMGLI